MMPEQYYDFKNKTVLITGASSGLGAQCARCLSDAGARVILAARREAVLAELANTLKNALVIKMDVGDRHSVTHAFELLEKAGEKIDICINNAAIAKSTPLFEEDSQQDFEQIMQINVMGVWYVTQSVAKHMKKHSIPGSIMNISSAGGDNYCRPNVSGYYASKAAVIKLTKNLVFELSPHQIRINAILPGTLYTDMTRHRTEDQQSHEQIKQSIPLKRIGSTQDLDAAILYLASNKASGYTTGSCLTVDGGLSCGDAS